MLVPTRLDKMCTVTEIFHDQFFEFPLFQSQRNLSEQTILNYLLLSPVEHTHKYIIHSLPNKGNIRDDVNLVLSRMSRV